MDIRYGTGPEEASLLSTLDLRNEFLIEGLFTPGELNLCYIHADRMIAGAAVPIDKAITLEAQDELRAEYFLERREIGILNLGGPGTVVADSQSFRLASRDGLYLGRGTKSVRFESADAKNHARFYLNSAPAHKEMPAVLIPEEKATCVSAGKAEDSNARVIRKYIHPDGAQSCQLVMGLTTLASGSVWNTMPCHTHERRMEVYLYFGLGKDAFALHLMGRPDETRHIAVRDFEAAISPSWSIHSGCGTSSYSFVWGMAGENQDFKDMDAVSMDAIL